MREEGGTILFRDVDKKFGLVVPSSGGDKSNNVFISAEATNIRLLGAEAADYQMFREGRWRAG
jgi:hypothetical protein